MKENREFKFNGVHAMLGAQKVKVQSNFYSAMVGAVHHTGATVRSFDVVCFGFWGNLWLKVFPFLKYHDVFYAYFWASGFTGCFILSESHLTFHTYPEHEGCFFDLFTCGTRCIPDQGLVWLQKKLECAGQVEVVAR
jgi:S-adenosylmethionine/arginine decarboxylase-like enzyme